MKKSKFELNKHHLRKVLIFVFNLKKSAAEVHQMIEETYGETYICERIYHEWFQCYKNEDFKVEDTALEA